MRQISLRTLVGSIGLTVALTVAASVPIGFMTVSYLYQASMASFKAELNAARLAKYIYAHGEMWQYQRIRLVELIELPESQAEIRQRVFDNKDKLVVTEGEICGSIPLSRSAPITVAGATVGRIEVETCLEEMLKRTGLVALFSFALGFAVFFALRILPLRVLDRTLNDLQSANHTISEKNQALEEQNQTLQQREVELRTQNYRFDMALNNMSQGLVMFDGEKRLIVCNEAYARLYALPPELRKPGTSLQAILEHRAATGSAEVGSLEQFISGRMAVADQGTRLSETHDLVDGRSIFILHEPMAGGGWVATHEDVTERRRSEAQIARMARYDALTDLGNRVLLREEMQNALTRLRRHGEAFALLCLDLDRFKAVNDALGHPAGDALLQQVAERLRRCVRETDTVVRLGGDEFAILQTAADQPNAASALAKRIVEALSEPYSVEGQQVSVGTSVGVAVAPNDGADPDLLVKNADLALYRAKADGKGRFCFFEPAMDARVQARRALELDLRNAYRNGEFELFYQPLVSFKNGHVCGFEALIRWRHPERGLVSPAAFIPIAEEIGLIGPLGDWVIREACREAASWPKDLRVAVNLSPDQFRHGQTLVQTVMSALAASRLPAGRLELEITESVLLAENEATLSTLHQLRALGVRISLDDFGTGYSSLSYLRKFPFDKIKIDQSFVRELSTRADCSAIVRAVVGLAKTLGMATVAEGVETSEQLERLREEGCTEVQGYLFSPPKPNCEIWNLIATCGLVQRKAA